MKKYIIEIMEFCDILFPTLHRVTVEAGTIESAVKRAFKETVVDTEDEVIKSLTTIDDKKHFINSYKYSSTADPELIAIVYNSALEDVGSNYRLLRGLCNNKECFNLINTVEEDI